MTGHVTMTKCNIIDSREQTVGLYHSIFSALTNTNICINFNVTVQELVSAQPTTFSYSTTNCGNRFDSSSAQLFSQRQ